MSAQRKPEKFPIQIVSLDAIAVDHDLQSRVSTSLEYQREFSAAMLRGDVFPPVTVFWDGETYWLADGFHRHGAAREASKIDKSLRGLKAEVREGTRQDAILFSAGANQKFAIPRTPEDIRKSVGMVLGDPERRGWAVDRIARHVGTSATTVRKYQLAYFIARGEKPPSEVERSDGRKRRANRFYRTPGVKKVSNRPRFVAYDQGRKINLGTDFGEAERELARVNLARAQAPSRRWDLGGLTRRRHVVRNFALRDVLLEGIAFQQSRYPGLWGYVSHGCVVVWTDLATPESLPLHVSIVLLARQHIDPNHRAVVICYHEDAAPAVLDLARQLGVEFRTPEELIAEVAEETGSPS